jgi:hypothetical protein
MADTKHARPAAAVEGDGVSYSGIVWFVVILTLTTVFCQLVVWGAFELMAWRVDRGDGPRAPLAAERPQPAIDGGRMVTGTDESPRPALLVSEPDVLREFRETERTGQSSYQWIDRNAGTIRIPIDRAKTLVLERGLPARPGPTPAAPTPEPAAAPGAATPPAPEPRTGAAH